MNVLSGFISKRLALIALTLATIIMLFSAYFVMKNEQSDGELYHDELLAEDVTFSSEWTDIDIRNIAKVERDKQMVGIVLKEPYWIDFDLGELKSGSGDIVSPEIRIVTTQGEIYLTYFGNARGKRLASYRPSTQLPHDATLSKLQIRCGMPLAVKKVIWTTYNIRDRK